MKREKMVCLCYILLSQWTNLNLMELLYTDTYMYLKKSSQSKKQFMGIFSFFFSIVTFLYFFCLFMKFSLDNCLILGWKHSMEAEITDLISYTLCKIQQTGILIAVFVTELLLPIRDLYPAFNLPTAPSANILQLSQITYIKIVAYTKTSSSSHGHSRN